MTGGRQFDLHRTECAVKRSRAGRSMTGFFYLIFFCTERGKNNFVLSVAVLADENSFAFALFGGHNGNGCDNTGIVVTERFYGKRGFAVFALVNSFAGKRVSGCFFRNFRPERSVGNRGNGNFFCLLPVRRNSLCRA